MIDTIEEFIAKYDETDKRFFYDNKVCIDVLEYYLDNYPNANLFKILNSQTLTEDFIEKYKERVNWSTSGIYKSNLPETFYEKYRDKINWFRVPYERLSYGFIERNVDKIDYAQLLFKRSDVGYDFYDKNRKYFNLYELHGRSSHPILNKLVKKTPIIDDVSVLDEKYTESRDFLLKNKFTLTVLEYAMDKYNINVIHLCEYHILSENFISKYAHRLDWYFIAKHQIISEEFIELYIDKFDKDKWKTLSRYQTLSDTFVDKHKDKVYWCYISIYQNISYNLLEENLYNYNLYIASENKCDGMQKILKKYKLKYEVDKLSYQLHMNEIRR